MTEREPPSLAALHGDAGAGIDQKLQYAIQSMERIVGLLSALSSSINLLAMNSAIELARESDPHKLSAANENMTDEMRRIQQLAGASLDSDFVRGEMLRLVTQLQDERGELDRLNEEIKRLLN